MKKYRVLLFILGTLIVVGGLSWLSYYVYESLNYFYTDNAQVSADMVTIIPEVTGELTAWNIQEGTT